MARSGLRSCKCTVPDRPTRERWRRVPACRERSPSSLDQIPTSVLLTPAMASTLRPRRAPGPTRCRLATRVAAGLSPAQAARAEALPEAELHALLARPDFGRLVRDFRDLAR